MIDLKLKPEGDIALWKSIQDFQSKSIHHPGHIAIAVFAPVPFKLSYTIDIPDGKQNTTLYADRELAPGIYGVVELLPDETKVLAEGVQEARP